MRTQLKRVKHWFLYPKSYRDFSKNLGVSKFSKDDLQDHDLKNKIFETYRDIFGHAGQDEWGEYAKCTICHKVYGIEKIHKNPEYIHVSDLPKKLPLSHCCYAIMDYFHNETSLQKRFEGIFNKKKSIVYILNDKKINKVVGLIAGYIAPIHVAWKESIHGKLALKDNSTLHDGILSESVIYIDELGIIKTHRRGRLPLFVLLLSFMKDAHVLGGADRILFWTGENSKLYGLIKQLPHNILLRDNESPARIVVALSFKKTFRKVKLLGLVYT